MQMIYFHIQSNFSNTNDYFFVYWYLTSIQDIYDEGTFNVSLGTHDGPSRECLWQWATTTYGELCELHRVLNSIKVYLKLLLTRECLLIYSIYVTNQKIGETEDGYTIVNVVTSTGKDTGSGWIPYMIKATNGCTFHEL